MGTRAYTEQRLGAFLSEIKRLKQSEFPYLHSKLALEELENTIQASLQKVVSIPQNTSQPVVNQRCAVELNLVLDCLPLMGFLLRSTNVRNAFETFRPILRLSKTLLKVVGVDPDKVRVILSSEWDYSPFVYQRIPYLTGYVLVGMPSTESSNPLILPLAGHELGHTVWEEGQIFGGFQTDLVASIVNELIARWADLGLVYPVYSGTPAKTPIDIAGDMFLMDLVGQVLMFAALQVEETFCDFLGLRLFGESYLYAFAYLISPCWGEYRSAEYPNTQVRAQNLASIAAGTGIKAPNGYVDWFDDLPLYSKSPADKLIVELADASLSSLIPMIDAKVEAIVNSAGIGLPSQVELDRIKERFEKVIPAEKALCLADIVNAGWAAYNDPNLWKASPWSDDRKKAILKDLVLKSIEMQDMEAIVQEVASGP